MPESTLEAWICEWFQLSAIEQVENLGFDLKNIPQICSFKLAGRISKCVQSWEIICPNAWVRGVLNHEYKLHWRWKKPTREFVGWNPPHFTRRNKSFS